MKLSSRVPGPHHAHVHPLSRRWQELQHGADAEQVGGPGGVGEFLGPGKGAGKKLP